MNNHESNILNNGEYFYMVKNITLFPILIMDVCIQVKVPNYFNNY